MSSLLCVSLPVQMLGYEHSPRHSLSNGNHWPCERRLKGSLGGAITEASSPLLRQLNNSLPRTPRSETPEPVTVSPYMERGLCRCDCPKALRQRR